MKLNTLRISNFQSFGQEPTKITFEDISYLIGPNGSRKKLLPCRLFPDYSALIQASDEF